MVPHFLLDMFDWLVGYLIDLLTEYVESRYNRFAPTTAPWSGYASEKDQCGWREFARFQFYDGGYAEWPERVMEAEYATAISNLCMGFAGADQG